MVKNFDELKSMPREKVAGKIVLFNYPFDKQMAAEGRSFQAYGEAVVYRSDGPSAAARQGAIACLIRSVGGADYRLPHTGVTDYAKDAPKIPAGAVTAEDADLIANLVPQGTGENEIGSHAANSAGRGKRERDRRHQRQRAP